MLTEIEQAATCTKFLCGPNSPILGGVPFFQLDQTGTTPAPEQGFRIVSFSNAWIPLSVDVEGAHLRGRFANLLVLQGEQLVGAKLVLEDEHGARHVIRFDERAQLQRYWEDGDDGTLLESWRMTSVPFPNDGGALPQPICDIEPNTTSGTPGDLAHHALIFRGDRYDAETGDVIATGEGAGPWFNIACAGDSLGKLLVVRHAEAAHDAAHPTTREQRQAALRMFRADYCGTGQPNTQLGTPIDWANAGGWNGLDASPTLDNVEAIWTEGGAACVTSPRHIDRDDIPCDIQTCTPEQVANWQQHGHLITINP